MSGVVPGRVSHILVISQTGSMFLLTAYQHSVSHWRHMAKMGTAQISCHVSLVRRGEQYSVDFWRHSYRGEIYLPWCGLLYYTFCSYYHSLATLRKLPGKA